MPPESCEGIFAAASGGRPTSAIFALTSGTTALVVNTDTRVLQGFASALRGEGYSVLEATSFEDGKQLWTATKPDVLVVDIRLGQFNGLQLLMRARSDRPDLHAIITCPFADAVLEAETRRFGGTFLIRPIEPQQIVSSIRQIQSPDAAPPKPLLERRRKAALRDILGPNGFLLWGVDLKGGFKILDAAVRRIIDQQLSPPATDPVVR